MRPHLPRSRATLAYCACLVLLAAAPAAAQYTDPPRTLNFWLSGGLGTGSAGHSSGLMAAIASAWISQGTLVGGVRMATVEPWDHGDKSSDVAVLVGARTPPGFGTLIGTVGYSSATTRCSIQPCAAEYSPNASGAMAFSLQGLVNISVVGLGVEVFGARGSGMNHFTAAALTLQFGWLAH